MRKFTDDEKTIYLWDWIEYEADEEIDFASIDFKMPMTEIYAGVQLPDLRDWERENL